MPHRRGLLALGAAAFMGRRAAAQDAWPSRPVRIVVPSGAAGSADIVARFLAERLTAAYGKPFVVENRPGLAGTIGTDVVAKSAPDGYSLVLISTNQAINETLQPRRPYHLLRDLVPVAGVNIFHLVLAVKNALPVRTVPELIAYARAHPGELDFASSGPGSIFHVAAEVFRNRAGIEMQHVPFRDYNAARTALMAGQLGLMFDATFSMTELLAAGRVRGLATTGPERSPLLPDLPTVADTLPGYEAALWNGLMGPAGLPPAIAADLNAAVNRILADPAVIAAQARVGAATMPLDIARFTAFLQAEIAKQRDAVRIARIAPE